MKGILHCTYRQPVKPAEVYLKSLDSNAFTIEPDTLANTSLTGRSPVVAISFLHNILIPSLTTKLPYVYYPFSTT